MPCSALIFDGSKLDVVELDLNRSPVGFQSPIDEGFVEAKVEVDHRLPLPEMEEEVEFLELIE